MLLFILKYEMILKHNNEIDFRQDKSINRLLGFHSKLCTSEFNGSENMINILTANSILVNIDIISGSYANGSTQPTIYSFFPNVSPGNKIIEKSQNLPSCDFVMAITVDTIHCITIWLTDQNGNELNLREENLLMRFHLREI